MKEQTYLNPKHLRRLLNRRVDRKQKELAEYRIKLIELEANLQGLEDGKNIIIENRNRTQNERHRPEVD